MDNHAIKKDQPRIGVRVDCPKSHMESTNLPHEGIRPSQGARAREAHAG